MGPPSGTSIPHCVWDQHHVDANELGAAPFLLFQGGGVCCLQWNLTFSQTLFQLNLMQTIVSTSSCLVFLVRCSSSVCLQVIKMHSFLDYIMGGCQIQFTVSTHTQSWGVTMETGTAVMAASLLQLAAAAVPGSRPGSAP